MKTRHYISFLLSLLLGIGTLAAQNTGRLYIPDLTALPGNTLSVPVYVENTTEIVAVQFTLQVPEGATLTSETAALTNRAADHSVTLREMDSQEYLFVIYSSTNSPIKGRTGKLMTVDMQVGNDYEEGSTIALALKDVVLSLRDGSNVLSSAEAGTISLVKRPDLCITNVKVDKTDCAPGEALSVSWQVQNVGGVETGDGWTEQISLVQSDGTSVLLGTAHYDETLSASGSVSRQATVTLSGVLGLDGHSKVQVQLIPHANTGESEGARSNNTATTETAVNISKLLMLTLPTGSIAETNTQPIRCSLARSGNRAQEQTFTLTATADSRLIIPQEVTIPAGQSAASFYIQIKDNTTLDDGGVITITASGSGYEAVSKQLTIEDNEYPDLTLTASKTEITEGDSFQLTITASRTSASPIEVTLTSENSKRFSFPSKVTIPAGETFATIDVVVVNNNEIELQESIAFHASVEKYGQGECIIIIDDDDMPTFTFTLSPETVSESDGYTALFGVIKRTDNLDKRVTIKLSDDSNDMLTYPNQTIVMAKNQTEAQFNIGVIDNDLVDGDHIMNVTAAVYASSCNCSVPDDTKGYMTATVTILDDDGPTLKIKPAGTAMLEGSEGNVFAISHNTQSDIDVRVRISSDKDDMLEYDHELIIPAGQSIANLLVNVKGNDQQDDSSIATFKVEAEGYAMGTCWIMITDQTLPDAIISLSASKTEAEAEQTVLLHAVVKNVGHAPLSSTTPVEISFSGRKETVSFVVGKSIAVEDSVVIEYNYDLPAITGKYYFVATVNAAGKESELIYANNTSAKVGITLLSPFIVTARANREIYQHTDSVYISGTATGSAGKKAKIEVYFINEGARQIVNTITDDDGNYTIGWKPLSKQSGHFIVGACYPGSNMNDEMDSFDVYGIRASDSFKTCELSQMETASGKIIIFNPGILAQTGLTLTPKANSDNCEFTYNVPNTIEAGQSVEIGYTIKGNDISEGRDWQQMPIEISTSEGSHLDYTIYYYVHPLKAKLMANESFINTTMTFGTPREYSVVIRNVGRAETGKITLSLPSWIQTITPSEMASLAQGDSTTIVFRFIPIDAMKLNVRVSGQIGVNCANGDGTAIRFNLTPVSETKGRVKFDVTDEYTYFTTEAPHVNNAKVCLKDPSTNEIVVEGITSEEGTFSVEVPEGYYYVTVDADKHNSYSNTMIVDPGVEKEEEVFLSYQAVTYSWEVVETDVEDEYEIETIVKYESRAPKPVVIITLPDEYPEPNSIIPVVVTNKGLVNALDFNLSLYVNDSYTLELMNNQSIDVLAPQQSHVFYAKLVPAGNEELEIRRKANNKRKCLYVRAYGSYKEPCPKYNGTEQTHVEKYWGDCSRNGSNGGSNGGGNNSSSGGPGRPSGNGGSSYDGGYYIDYVVSHAKDCDNKEKPEEENGGGGVFPPIVGGGDPPEPPCVDGNLEIKLVYKLIPVTGTRYEMKGVAADGVSQVMIVLDPEESRLPKVDCNGNNIEYECHWSLSEQIGKLENESSINNIIYSAPDGIPTDGSSYPINAHVTVLVNNRDEYKYDIPIKIVRVPLALIHGLKSSPDCWKGYKEHLISFGYYDEWQINNVDYHYTHNSHFSVNYKVATKAIKYSMGLYKLNGYVAEKVDIIGHSMGGILSRFHVQQNRERDDVHKLITVNTPHSGSEFGDIASQDLQFAGAAWLAGFSPLDAVFDLAVNSSAIDNDLNGPLRDNNYIAPKVPVHAITTTSLLGANLGTGAFYLLRKLIGMYNHSAEYVLYLYDSDAIVSRDSQKGGCKAISHFDGYSHTGSPDGIEVWNKLTSLLCGSTESFSRKWFNPVDRKFVPIILPNFDRRNTKPKEFTSQIDIDTDVKNDSLIVFIDNELHYNEHLIAVSFEDDNVQVSDTISLKCQIPSTFSGNIKVVAICKSDDGSVSIDSTFVIVPDSRTQLTSVYAEQVTVMTNDSIVLSIQGKWADGSETTIVPDIVEPDDKLAKYSNGKLVGIKSGIGKITLGFKGLTCSVPLIVYSFSDNSNVNSDESSSICSTVTLSFKQKNVMTRQAFRGTLSINNGNETTAMKDVKLKMEVRDMDGKLTTSHEFQINAESLNGFSGELDLGSGWTLAGGGTGVATILFIPTKYAAPTEPMDYSFGGSFSYIDPYTGLTVTHDLSPVTLTVNPSPNLDLAFFMQRDVYGDDPLTTDFVEPSEPAEFSLLINNIGSGDATNVYMVTSLPVIVDNEKGLAVSFEMLSTQLNGSDKTLVLGGNMPTDFGTISAHSQAYAQWWFRSSLLGHFTEYNLHTTHVTSYGNPDLSLLNEVTIHELIRSIKVDEDQVTGFVANDLPDAKDMPDIIYFTDGTKADVVVAANAVWKKQSNTEYLLTITPSQAGWNYGHITDPTYGRAELIGIRRQSDGKEINLRNFWQTDRTLRDGKDWLYENNLHFIDQMGNGAETYVLTFEPRPDMELQVASFEGVPEEGFVLREPLQTVTVTFNKAIDAETFTREDITLNCQGEQLEGDIIITPVSDTQFTLDLSQLTAGNGYYVLTVQTADITDYEGYNGAVGKTATWIQFTEATTLALSFYDAEVTYGNSFTEPRILTNSPAVPTFTITNPLVASVSTDGRVTINAVGTTQVNVALEETPMSDAAQTSYRLTVLQPEGYSEAPAGIETVSITIPEGQTMTTFCSPWPIDFSDATNDCRAYMAFTYSEDIVECAEVVEAKGGAGLLIVGKPGTYTFPVRTSFYDPIENLFVGTLAPTYVEEMNDDMTNLGLKDIKFVPLNAGVIKANTAYLPIAMDDNVDAMTIVLKAMTGLRIITEQFDEVPWFNISGMKVSRPSAKGIYIHNGRKVVVQ